MNRVEKLIKSKKGFSLVELIIVIAIMAILVGVVASQVIPYMEKSRQGKDLQQLSAIESALAAAIASSPVNVPSFPANSGDFEDGIPLCAKDGDFTGDSSYTGECYPAECLISHNLFSLFDGEGGEAYVYADFLDKCIVFQDKMKSKAYMKSWEGTGYENNPETNRGVDSCFIRTNFSDKTAISAVFMSGNHDLKAQSE